MTTGLTCTTGRRDDGTPVLAVAGEIDMRNAETFAAARAEAAAEAGGTDTALLVDLTAVTYLDSGGLAALFSHADGIEVLATPLLAPVLTVSGLADITTVHAT